MEPITFTPLYMERVWGGRALERVYGRSLPDSATPIGESWEIVDREEAQSVVDSGPLRDLTLHQLWRNQREEIFGSGFRDHRRFPILIKVLDAREDLSLQVHPPEQAAETLGGTAKTEMWFIADCEPGAKLYAGLKRGVTRETFEEALRTGSVAECVHSIAPQPGDSIFIPSGRIHAIGGGFLIHEIQQNSDTTYRVFDWNRAGLDGQPRELHVRESLASIDFEDIEPAMDPPAGDNLARCAHFSVDKKSLTVGETIGNPRADRFSILSIVEGVMESGSGVRYGKGRFLLLPVGAAPLSARERTTVLQITLPE